MPPTCNRIKVVHIITRFDKGGSAENTFLTVRGLDKTRYEVVLIKGASLPGKPEDPENCAVRANITAARESQVRLFCLRRLVRDLAPLSDVTALFSLIRIIRRERPQIVHTHTSKAGILGRWAAYCCRVPIIVHTPHGHVFWGYFNRWQTLLFILLERWTARITTAMVALTPQEREDHLRFRISGEEDFSIIHSGVDLEGFFNQRFDPVRARLLLGVPPEIPVVGTVGRLTAVKGQDVLLRAVGELIRRGEKVFLLVLGDGELRPDLERLVKHEGIEDYVRFLGWRPDVAQIMAAYDILCLTSHNEGMGKVLVEAMAMGIPIIASDIGGIRDMVLSGKNGLLIPAGDAGACADAIVRLCRDPERRIQMGAAGKEIVDRYSAEAMIKKIDQLYRKLLNENAPM